jgi:hypothetical protein
MMMIAMLYLLALLCVPSTVFSLHAFRTKLLHVAVSGLIQMQLGSLIFIRNCSLSRPSAPLATFLMMMACSPLPAELCFWCVVFFRGRWMVWTSEAVAVSLFTARYAAVKTSIEVSVFSWFLLFLSVVLSSEGKGL